MRREVEHAQRSLLLCAYGSFSYAFWSLPQSSYALHEA